MSIHFVITLFCAKVSILMDTEISLIVSVTFCKQGGGIMLRRLRIGKLSIRRILPSISDNCNEQGVPDEDVS